MPGWEYRKEYKMSCYNTLIFNCPSCGFDIEKQSKGGNCSLGIYRAEEASLSDLAYIEDEIVTCHICEKSFRIKIQKIIRPYLQKIED
jgi:transcription elongation factor Elf1